MVGLGWGRGISALSWIWPLSLNVPSSARSSLMNPSRVEHPPLFFLQVVITVFVCLSCLVSIFSTICVRYSPIHLTTQHLLDTALALTKHLLNEETSLATPDSSKNGRHEDHLKQREDRVGGSSWWEDHALFEFSATMGFPWCWCRSERPCSWGFTVCF